MSPARWTITNRVELRSRARLEAIRDRVVEAIVGIAPSANDTWEPLGGRCDGDWIVFHDQKGLGFGFFVDDGVSELQRQLAYVRRAASIAQSFRELGDLSLSLSLRRDVVESWRSSELRTVGGVVRFAVSDPIPGSAVTGRSALVDKLTRLRLCAYLDREAQISRVGGVRVGTLEVFAMEVGMKGMLRCEEREEMSIEVSEMEVEGEQKLPGVRIDLGEIEVSLADLAALRPGAVINLGVVELDRCFIRVGSAALAEGRIRREGGELHITLQAVG